MFVGNLYHQLWVGKNYLVVMGGASEQVKQRRVEASGGFPSL